jgi:hypothetical protein
VSSCQVWVLHLAKVSNTPAKHVKKGTSKACQCHINGIKGIISEVQFAWRGYVILGLYVDLPPIIALIWFRSKRGTLEMFQFGKGLASITFFAFDSLALSLLSLSGIMRPRDTNS